MAEIPGESALMQRNVTQGTRTFLDALLPAEGADFVPEAFLLVEIFARNWRPRRLWPTQGAHFCATMTELTGSG